MLCPPPNSPTREDENEDDTGTRLVRLLERPLFEFLVPTQWAGRSVPVSPSRLSVNSESVTSPKSVVVVRTDGLEPESSFGSVLVGSGRISGSWGPTTLDCPTKNKYAKFNTPSNGSK